ncbi:MAG: TylF/MycF family methyltransferase [Gammaproteobacteria bacterium]|nr:TylF/MycF family methyltransferase [Gammaproteobacteria bacterium]
MKARLLKYFKKYLTIVGARMPVYGLFASQMIVNYMKLGRWYIDNNFELPSRSVDRDAVFQRVVDIIGGDEVLYLEFGVHKGASMKFWSAALTNKNTNLIGFDSFEGLPEAWGDDANYQKGALDVGGKLPDINDVRVKFQKGWFEETLPVFEFPEYETLIIMLDADLYSSTKYVLVTLNSRITTGTYIFFDDMNRPEHEPKAFHEYIIETGKSFELIATDYALNRSFFRCK